VPKKPKKRPKTFLEFIFSLKKYKANIEVNIGSVESIILESIIGRNLKEKKNRRYPRKPNTDLKKCIFMFFKERIIGSLKKKID